MNRYPNLVRYLTLLSFLPPALGVVYVAMIGRKGVAVAGLLVLLVSGGLSWVVERRAGL